MKSSKLNITRTGHRTYSTFDGVQTVIVTENNIIDARNWALDCDWLDGDDLETMDDETIIRGTHRHFDGGISNFVRSCSE